MSVLPLFSRITPATYITLVRLLLTPVVAWAIYYGYWQWATLCFVVGALSDALDGYVARRWHQETQLGAYLDPLVDKIFITTLYVVLWCSPALTWHLPGWFVAIIVAKELILLAGACYWGLWRKSVPLTPNYEGKLAMFFQILLGWNVLLTQVGMPGLAVSDLWVSVWCTLGCVLLALRSYTQRIFHV